MEWIKSTEIKYDEISTKTLNTIVVISEDQWFNVNEVVYGYFKELLNNSAKVNKKEMKKALSFA